MDLGSDPSALWSPRWTGSPSRAAQPGAAVDGAPPTEPPAPLVEGGAPETEVVQVASEAPESPPVNEVSEQANQKTNSQPESIVINGTEGKGSSAEMLCEELEEGISDDEMFKLTQKRKSSGSGHSNAKACKASRGVRSSQGSAPSSQEDEDDLYPPSDIRTFLETTKGQRLPSVEDHFPDLKLFLKSSKPLT